MNRQVSDIVTERTNLGTNGKNVFQSTGYGDRRESEKCDECNDVEVKRIRFQQQDDRVQDRSDTAHTSTHTPSRYAV